MASYSFTGNKGPRRHLHSQITSLNWPMASWKTVIRASPVFEVAFLNDSSLVTSEFDATEQYFTPTLAYFLIFLTLEPRSIAPPNTTSSSSFRPSVISVYIPSKAKFINTRFHLTNFAIWYSLYFLFEQELQRITSQYVTHSLSVMQKDCLAFLLSEVTLKKAASFLFHFSHKFHNGD